MMDSPYAGIVLHLEMHMKIFIVIFPSKRIILYKWVHRSIPQDKTKVYHIL